MAGWVVGWREINFPRSTRWLEFQHELFGAYTRTLEVTLHVTLEVTIKLTLEAQRPSWFKASEVSPAAYFRHNMP